MPADRVHDVLIVGAGVLGCALAVSLSRQGRQVLLIERNLNEPDRIVGELLQPGGVAALSQLDLDSCLEGIDAVPVTGYRIFYHGEVITFLYPPIVHSMRTSAEKNDPERPKGRSFHHGRFVMKLRDAARRESHVEIIQATASELLWSESPKRVVGVRCRSLAAEQSVDYYAQLTIIADGQASNFRSKLTGRPPVANSRFWGLELDDADLGSYSLALGIIGHDGPVLMYQIGEREVRILIDIPDTVYKQYCRHSGVQDYIRTNVIPTLPETVRPAVKKALAAKKLRSMPNSWLPPSANRIPGVVLLGDAMNMRHPLTGGGMTVALNDVVLLSQLLSPQQVPSLNDTDAVLRQMQKFHRKRKAKNASLNILAQALYCLFVADDPLLQVLQRGFMKYIKKGGSYVEEPSGLMGGVYHSPFLLCYHFFAIAAYSLWALLCEVGADSPRRLPGAVLQSFLVFWRAVKLISPYILAECSVRIPNDYSPPPPSGKEALFVWVVSIVHAGVHIIGWNFDFPTYTELLLWRASTIVLLAVMAVGGAVPVLSTREWFDFTFNLLWIWVRDARRQTWVRRHLFNSVVDVAYIVYILARLIIFVEIFISFRSLPASAYDDVSWTAFLPHV
ncbi:squalene epoxidase-domain-containing protein [Hypoxylon sp. NC1633]|nr:squalene epoxidase-domain-containing protein [Hypoxylon sp. NC1633]